MPQIPITMPQLGESIAEATIVRLNSNVGDRVETDEEIMEVETNKAVMTVTVPCGGTIERICVELQQSYPVGAVLGYLEVSEEDAAKFAPATTAPTPSSHHSETSLPAAAPKAFAPKDVHPTLRGLPVPVSISGASFLSPRLRARMAELGLHAADLAGIAGSGAAGRVTVEDFERFVTQLQQNEMSPASTMRVAVADAMRRSWTRPLATVGRPIVLDALFKHRNASSPKAGPALYVLRALGIALGENSAPAGRLVGDRIVHPPAIDIGFAVEAEDGVLVPVLREVDQTPLAELVEPYSNLVALARQRRIPPESTGGSIATVTNFGSFGLTWATPIPLPEQTMVLGMGAGRKVPNWDEASGTFKPQTEAQLTLSFDHRVLDGGGAGRLLERIAGLLQNPGLL